MSHILCRLLGHDLRYEAIKFSKMAQATTSVSCRRCGKILRDPWKDTVLEELFLSFEDTGDYRADPRGALDRIITLSQELALDPAISKGATVLYNKALDDAVEAAKKQAGKPAHAAIDAILVLKKPAD